MINIMLQFLQLSVDVTQVGSSATHKDQEDSA